MAYTRLSGIYLIKNYIDKRVYVGSSKNLSRRRQTHFLELKNGENGNRELQAFYNQYGPNSLYFGVIEYLPVELLIEREQHFLDAYLDKFNLCPIAGVSNGYKYTEEQKVYLKRQKKPLTEEHKNKIRMVLVERNKTPLMRQLTIERNKNRVWSEESKLKISRANKKYGKTG